ncbi:MAG: hypothetical protein M0D55_18695 [Elusimicrobiota bacterium]|nr:MAG: hypothetical protein M0D55_18695 [Elusimicrobiota bacterium]
MRAIAVAALLLMAAAPARADGPFAFADGSKFVVNRSARPRTASFYGKSFELLKEDPIDAKETGILTVLAAENLASLAYTGAEGKRLAVWNSKGRRIADLPVLTLVAEIAMEDGTILAGDPKTGLTVLDRKGKVLEVRPPRAPTRPRRSSTRSARSARAGSRGGATADAGVPP